MAGPVFHGYVFRLKIYWKMWSVEFVNDVFSNLIYDIKNTYFFVISS